MSDRTDIVLIPLDQRTPLSMTTDGFLVFEVDDNFVIPIRKRPVMPGIHDWAACETRSDIFSLALMINLEHDKEKEETQGNA